MDDESRDSEDRKPIWQASEKDRQIDADAYHIWTPRPLIRSVYWKPDPEPPRDAVSGSYEVFLDQRVFVGMHEHVWKADLGQSQFGYLIGDLCEDPTASRRFVIITAAVPSRFPFDDSEPERISAEASVALQLEVERRRGVLVGWYHSHRSGSAVLSPEDVATHDRLFSEPWQVAFLFVTDPHAPAGACFRRTPDGFDRQLRLPFYEMVTNESLLAKGVRRSRIDWENISTLDQVRSEPPPRPEPPPVPEPPPDEELVPDVEPEAEPEIEPDSSIEVEQESQVEAMDAAAALAEEAEDDLSVEIPEEMPKEVEEEVPDELLDEVPSEEMVEVEDEADELDFDALIAEVESAGLSEDVEGLATGDVAVTFDLDVGSEPNLETVPLPDPDSGAEGDLGFVPAPDLETEEDVVVEVGPSPTVADLEEPEPVQALEALVEVESELISEALVEAETELSAPAPGSVVPASFPDEPLAPVPVPDKGRKLRNRILAGAGIVIALGVVGVLVQLLVQDPDGSSAGEAESTPAAVDRPVGQPAVAGEVPDDDGSTGAVEDPSADQLQDGAGVEDEGVDSAGVAVPPPVEVQPVSLDELQQLSDRVLESISTYYGRDGTFLSGEIGCPELQTSFAEVMDSWIDYSTRGKAGWQGRLPPDLVERDERLYLGVQDVERLFEASSCPRP